MALVAVEKARVAGRAALMSELNMIEVVMVFGGGGVRGAGTYVVQLEVWYDGSSVLALGRGAARHNESVT